MDFSVFIILQPTWTCLGVDHTNAMFVFPRSTEIVMQTFSGPSSWWLYVFPALVCWLRCQHPLSTSLVSHSAVWSTTAPANGSVNVASWQSLGTGVDNGCRQRLLLMAVGNGCCQQHLQPFTLCSQPKQGPKLVFASNCKTPKTFWGKF